MNNDNVKFSSTVTSVNLVAGVFYSKEAKRWYSYFRDILYIQHRPIA